ncbi:MAG: phosphatidylcholine/phosphatidylserine synthase [Tepidisphaera sp.]
MFTLDADSKQHVAFRKIVPNLFTTVSLCSGLASIHYSLKAAQYVSAKADPALIESTWKTAMLAIGVAAVFDLLDGRAARLLQATSRFGAVFDSLSDFLSFGVAPAILIHQWMLKDHRSLGMAAVMAFVLCAALRLARFTAMPRQPKSKSVLGKFFIGLPTPAAGGAMLVPAMLDVAKYFPIQTGRVSDSTMAVFETIEPTLVIVNTLLIAGLMISRVPMFSFKKVRVRRHAVPFLMVLIGMFVLAMFRDAWLTIPVAVWTYIAMIPLSVLSHKRVVQQLRSVEGGAVVQGAAL